MSWAEGVLLVLPLIVPTRAASVPSGPGYCAAYRGLWTGGLAALSPGKQDPGVFEVPA